MKKGHGKRKHAVKAKLKGFELTRAGTSLNLLIYADEQKIGELVVGRGSLFWYGGRRRKRKRIDWSAFSRKMDELAYGL